ncbi:Golgi-associated plant pathogenesis-related protein 1 [Octopus bimaculoides]|uniref:Golgi-associated plant pathogenesis-related protein 1 n=1 Tax=Octopus bimaculoides TaxID=37653 RepID=UPI0022E43032|nr:Golgi-associated plant pathogenesis-related protein 1 [Octopus bimaculoides]
MLEHRLEEFHSNKSTPKQLMEVEASIKFQQDVLEAQNCYRQNHGCPEMVTSVELCRDAQSWADYIGEKGYIQYSETSGVGENIGLLELNGKTPSGKELVKKWYEEIHHYDFDKPQWRKGCQHFSQMLWRSTTEFGVGLAKMKKKDQYVVVIQYRPPGNNNLPGEFRKNIPPPK